MKKLDIQGTPKTPAVVLDPNSGEFRISGRSVHENSDKFYMPIFDELGSYGENPAEHTKARFELEYFNTSSAKYLLDLLKKLEEISLAGNNVSVQWVYDVGDLDMEEAGNDYNDLVDLEVEVLSRS